MTDRQTERQTGITGLLSLGDSGVGSGVEVKDADCSYSWLWWPKCQAPPPPPVWCGRHYWSVTKLPCVCVARIVHPSSAENTDISVTLCREKYFSVGLCLMSEPSMNVSAISSNFNHQLSDKYWDIILFLVWDCWLWFSYTLSPPGLKQSWYIYWLTLSISLTLGRSHVVKESWE